MEEKTLIKAYRDNVHELYRFVSRRCGGNRSLAEDVTQETWLKAVVHWRKKGLPDEPLLGFVEVPGGPFLMGEGEERHEVELPTYYMARYPVTHAQYAVFVQETGHGLHGARYDFHRPFEWREGSYPPQRANQPVVLVTWYDALEYCRWLTEKLRTWEGTLDPLAHLLRRS